MNRRSSTPLMGWSAAALESVRFDPELSDALRGRAEQKDGRTRLSSARRFAATSKRARASAASGACSRPSSAMSPGATMSRTRTTRSATLP